MNLFRPQASSSGITAMKLSCGFWTLFIGKLGEGEDGTGWRTSLSKGFEYCCSRLQFSFYRLEKHTRSMRM
jgi:hypothetical protein